MSSTEIFGFNKQGEAYFYDEVKNSWRGGMAIWRILEEKYLPPYMFGFSPSRCSGSNVEAMGEIWDLVLNENVTETDKICLATTFDKSLVKKEDIPKIVKAFREFDGETSLKEQADILEEMYQDEDCIAVGWNQTSVNGDNWCTKGGYDEEEDDCIPYNCLTMEEHCWLEFKEVEE